MIPPLKYISNYFEYRSDYKYIKNICIKKQNKIKNLFKFDEYLEIENIDKCYSCKKYEIVYIFISNKFKKVTIFHNNLYTRPMKKKGAKLCCIHISQDKNYKNIFNFYSGINPKYSKYKIINKFL